MSTRGGPSEGAGVRADLTGFLSRMAASSAARLEVARARRPERWVRRVAADASPAPPLHLDPAGFDLMAEIKRRSPTLGPLGGGDAGRAPSVAARAAAYERAGAAAISVITEPSAFDGSMADLAVAVASVRLPVLRKDFIVAPYQVYEARAAGAAGVLVVVKLLHRTMMQRLAEAAAEFGLFLLVEAFDEDDLARAQEFLESRPSARCLLGLNARDLRDLGVDRERARRLPARGIPGVPDVAESGIGTPAEAAEAASRGYAMALVGTALMQAVDPAALVKDMIAAGRDAASRRREAVCPSR